MPSVVIERQFISMRPPETSPLARYGGCRRRRARTNVLVAADQIRVSNDVFGRYQQVIWQERDGLPQNTVLAIATTRDG
jgi:hypothetical protein